MVAYTNAIPGQGGAAAAMDDDTGLLFDLPSVGRKKVSPAFDGGRITSDGGVALLALTLALAATCGVALIDRSSLTNSSLS